MMKKLLLVFFLAFTFGNSYAQELWRSVSNEEMITTEKVNRDSNPRDFKLFALDLNALKSVLATAPSRDKGQQSNTVVTFPNVKGELEKFRIYEASVLHPDLAARHPEIQSYVGKGIDDPTATIRFSVTLFGLHTMTFSGVNGTTYIDPYTKDLKNYIIYSRQSLTTTKSFKCDVVDADNLALEIPADMPLQRSNNSLFKTYRLAMACTIEYAAFHIAEAGVGGGTLAQKKAAVLAAMAVTVARIDGVYERDLAVTLVLIPNNEDIIFVTSDTLDNSNTANALLNQIQDVIDGIVGFASYDIGHVVSTGGGGVAQRPAVCSTGKARGVTGLPSPVGDPYDIDFVAHEMGHQFGGSHTFNSDQDACAPPNRMTTSSYEPGSGTTIMAYAGICAPHNVQLHSDAYFHARSLIEIQSVINTSGNCAATVPNGNTAPVVSAGSNYTIPFGTAFALTGSATDTESPAGLTYCWEQFNREVSVQPPLATNTTGPNFRSYEPTASPKRYFPKFSDVLANNLTPTWEVVPNVARVMDFSLVVRDNGVVLGGQTERATMEVTFANVGPFKVTSQTALEAWAQNSTQQVTWDVAGTTANGINTALVNIRLSIDGGATFPYLLAENTPNDGSESITAPDAVSLNCRLMVESVGNVFYALNSKAFAIGYEIQNTCTTYNFNTPFALTTAYAVKSITVPATGLITDVNIHVNATHPNLQNMAMALIAPGVSLNTFYNQQCSGNANMNVTFDAQAPAFACASPLAGSMQAPSGTSFNSLNGLSPTGNWQFGFKSTPAAGTIDSFWLEVCAANLVILGTQQFAFDNFALYPNPNGGAFNVRFNSASGNKINIAVHDMRGRKIFEKAYSNSGLFDQNVKLDNAQAGIYLVSVADGDKKIVKRIVIE